VRILNVFGLVAALAFGAATVFAQVTVRLSVPIVPLAVTAFTAPALSSFSAALMMSAPAAENPLETGDYGMLFDGAVQGADGAAVHPRLIDGPQTVSLSLQLGIVRGAVERSLPALRESVALGSWNGPHTTLSDSCCADAAPKLAALLHARSIPVRLIVAEFHYYVILDLPENQIVIDPTIRQFFGKKAAPRGVPDVSVGKLGELGALFERYKKAKTTHYETSRIYFSDAVSHDKRLAALEAEIRRGSSSLNSIIG
jgi:hypothetical protein